MAMSAILSAGIPVDAFQSRQKNRMRTDFNKHRISISSNCMNRVGIWNI
jgi:hypothetical protein